MTRILTTEITDNLTNLTASEEVQTFEINNIQSPITTSVWRSTSLTPFIVGKFEIAKTIDFWGPWYSNARDGDQTQLQLADTQANLILSPLLDTGLVSALPGVGSLPTWFKSTPYVHQRSFITTSPAPISALWFRIDFDFSTNPDGYVQLSTLMLCESVTPQIGHQTPWDGSNTTRAMNQSILAGGGLSRGSGSNKRPVNFQLIMSDDEYSRELDPILRERRQQKPIGVILNENENNHPMNEMFFGYVVSDVTRVRGQVGSDNPGQAIINLSLIEP